MSKTLRTLRSPEDLEGAALVSSEQALALADVASRYAIAVPPALATLIDKTDPEDPIARQFVPQVAELHHAPHELADPIGDHVMSPLKGLVHRYRDRVLLKIVGVCPVYCRFCFRREMVGPGAAANLTKDEVASALRYIAERPEIWEVILTGGDPFVLSADRVRTLMAEIGQISHVKVVRWHTRVPVAAPHLITEEFVSALLSMDRQVVVSAHVNHVRELTEAARAALKALSRRGVQLVSQTVLLRGVNDHVERLEALMRALVEVGVRPYHLHHPDLAPGTGHFQISLKDGQALIHALRQRLSGIAMPTYVLDIPGGFGKVPVGPSYVQDGAVFDPAGRAHAYPTRQG